MGRSKEDLKIVSGTDTKGWVKGFGDGVGNSFYKKGKYTTGSDECYDHTESLVSIPVRQLWRQAYESQKQWEGFPWDSHIQSLVSEKAPKRVPLMEVSTRGRGVGGRT